jgi:type II secretory pathway predicted ATPase ExeA
MRLRREHVVDEAIVLLDADGLDALTLRKLATRLGVQAGALYWHFASKQALLDAMARITPGGTCGRVTGSAATGGAAAVRGWDMTATPSGGSRRFRIH